jgi:hypothetical protein
MGTLSYQEQLTFIENEGIDYVFFGPEEDAQGELAVEQLDYLQLGIQVGEYRVYKVVEPQGVTE